MTRYWWYCISHKEQRAQHVIFVGGFGASDYLVDQVTEILQPAGLSVLRPESHVSVYLFAIHFSVPLLTRISGSRNKAVSDGAISFYLDHFVRTRVSKLTYGNICHIAYDPNDPEHHARVSTAFTSASGRRLIPDAFDTILAKVHNDWYLTPGSQALSLIMSNRISRLQRKRSSGSRIVIAWRRATLRLSAPRLSGAIEGLTESPSGDTLMQASIFYVLRSAPS